MKQLEDQSSAGAKQSFVAEQVRRQQDTPQVGRLLSLYIDDSVPDPTPFGDVRQRAYKIMPRDALLTTAQRMSAKPVSKLAFALAGGGRPGRAYPSGIFDRWYVALDLAATNPGQPVAGGAGLGQGRVRQTASAYRNGRSLNVQRPRYRNACGRTC
ncbi:hypothetical protein [Pseudomonas syringae]|uniref:hypothetical protein n=1 Tax=Pseudomonas syringae TaxID=317 RepID=UPI00396A53EC